MGSLTVRNLPHAVKKRLRLRAAAHGRAMGEEGRLLLAEGSGDTPVAARSESPVSMINAWMSRSADAPVARTERSARPARQSATPRPAVTARRILLIISGGIAAYKSLDLIRRLRERGY